MLKTSNNTPDAADTFNYRQRNLKKDEFQYLSYHVFKKLPKKNVIKILLFNDILAVKQYTGHFIQAANE